MIHPQLVSVGILVLGLAIFAPGPTGHAAPLPPPKKMTLPPPAEVHLNSLRRALDRKLERCKDKPEERGLSVNARYDFYSGSIECVQEYLDGRPQYPFGRPLTIEERRGLRDLLHRLQRELAEGQANGTVGHETFTEAWRRHRAAPKNN
jgi:hypothetical protein